MLLYSIPSTILVCVFSFRFLNVALKVSFRNHFSSPPNQNNSWQSTLVKLKPLLSKRLSLVHCTTLQLILCGRVAIEGGFVCAAGLDSWNHRLPSVGNHKGHEGTFRSYPQVGQSLLPSLVNCLWGHRLWQEDWLELCVDGKCSAN